MQETLNVANVSVSLHCYCAHTVALLPAGVAQPIVFNRQLFWKKNRIRTNELALHIILMFSDVFFPVL